MNRLLLYELHALLAPANEDRALAHLTALVTHTELSAGYDRVSAKVINGNDLLSCLIFFADGRGPLSHAHIPQPLYGCFLLITQLASLGQSLLHIFQQ